MDCLVFCGSYDGDHPGGIYAARFSPGRAGLNPIGSVAEVQNASFLSVHPHLPVLYSVSEVRIFKGEACGAVFAWRVDPDGRLAPMGHRVTLGRGPCHLLASRDGSALVVANYVDGSVTWFRIEPGGALSEAVETFQHSGTGPIAERQSKAHAHQIVLAPDSVHMAVPDLGADRLYLYRFDSGAKDLRRCEVPFVELAPGTGPRHAVFSPDGHFLHLVGELDCTLRTYVVDHTRLTYTLINSAVMPGRDQGCISSPAAIVMDSCGRFLYCSLRLKNVLLLYELGRDGLPSLRQVVETGVNPRFCGFTPDEQYVFVTAVDADVVNGFKRDPVTGLLSATNLAWIVPRPACLAFLPHP